METSVTKPEAKVFRSDRILILDALSKLIMNYVFSDPIPDYALCIINYELLLTGD
jgi:hypothetical protein